jgi:hypothetical protein
MKTITPADRQAVKNEAQRFLTEYGFNNPPLPPEEALAARKLEVSPLSLDDLIVNSNLPEHEKTKIQAMLDAADGKVAFRKNLHPQQRNWGSLHEIGHSYINWHRELLCWCPLSALPANLQKKFEGEADVFAAESFFFCDKFLKLAEGGEVGLLTPINLATEIFQTSLTATIVHYVENSRVPCCLLIWKPVKVNGILIPTQASLHYYVKSNSFNYHFQPGQVTDEDDEAIIRLLSEPSYKGIVKHEMRLTKNGNDEDAFISKAESFSNSYAVFTFLYELEPMPFTQPTRLLNPNIE